MSNLGSYGYSMEFYLESASTHPYPSHHTRSKRKGACLPRGSRVIWGVWSIRGVKGVRVLGLLRV